jgi:AraC-like DNA-binding protein
MDGARGFAVSGGTDILLKDMGISPQNVLRRAELPVDLFSRKSAKVGPDEYYRLWRSLEEEAKDPTLPIRIGEALSVEAFDPLLFAALSSPNLDTALNRICRFKPLISPIRLELDAGAAITTLWIHFPAATEEVPPSLVAVELIFFVQLARLATRANVRPVRVLASRDLAPAYAYADYFGVSPITGYANALSFTAADASRPFLTANKGMWDFFEPDLQRRLSELDRNAGTRDRVRGALLELLPSGRSSVQAVSKALGMAPRTLQRRLNAEGTSFKDALKETRQELAEQYLRDTEMSGAEISYLLGFDDPNSFFRAFRSWTGRTPETVRKALQSGH